MPSPSGRDQRQLVVVGAGAAGLYTALRAAREGAQVTLISATELAETSSYWAQGGLAAALAAEDSPELHLEDTLRAGRGAVRPSAARVLVEEAPQAVEDLARLGVTFDADRTGAPRARARRRPQPAPDRARRWRRNRPADRPATLGGGGHRAADRGPRGPPVSALLTHEGRCTGVVLDDGERLLAPATVLSTGGAAALWARTTNPAGAVGTGLLLAYAAGAALADIEFMQFHPTAVVAARSAAMACSSPRRSAARAPRCSTPTASASSTSSRPRDEVARAIQRAARGPARRRSALDMREVDPALFPNVVSALRQAGIDPERELDPGRTGSPLHDGRDRRPTSSALDACPVCSPSASASAPACTGPTGSPRTRSSECFVFGARAARAALRRAAAVAGRSTARRTSTATAAPQDRAASDRVLAQRAVAVRRACERDGAASAASCDRRSAPAGAR